MKGKSKKLMARLEIVWGNYYPPSRFHPKSLDGGTGWGVFDQKEGRFLTDSEVKRISVEKIREETFVN